MLIFRKWGWWLAIVCLVIFLDQWSKNWIVHHFAWGHSEHITSFFNLVRVHNPGAAFSFLAQGSGWQRWFFTVLASVMCVFMLWLIHRHPEKKLLCGALSFIIGGALGNVIDRIQYGYVVDMLDFHALGWHFPAFNLADSAITLGAILLILEEFRNHKP